MLNHGGRPIADMSRTLQGSELHYPSVEKEATSILVAVCKWCHLYAGLHFTLITDQRSVAFMLGNRKCSKIKKNKIEDWKLELPSFCYTAKYRPGKDNVAPDSFTRVFCFQCLHLTWMISSRPCVTQMLHIVCSKNIPYSTENEKRTCYGCRVYTELKPLFYRPTSRSQATQPMERLSMDFKGPLSSASRNTSSHYCGQVLMLSVCFSHFKHEFRNCHQVP